ncbi:MAG: hypothetical protein IT431_12705 [Phycisphaerales bacterium]|nr:hypothetical protein [Phycisphaerales bacterium]
MDEGPRAPAPSACPECEYSLAGLPALSREHPCPECGYPAALFCPPEQWLRHADRSWLRRVVLGMRLTVFSARWLLWSFLAMLILMVVSVIAETVSEYTGIGPDMGWFWEIVFWAVFAVGIGAHAAGCVLASSPPPPGGPPDRRARRLVRWCGGAFAPACSLGSIGLMWISEVLPLWALYALGALLFANAVVYLAAAPLWTRHLEWRTGAWRLDRPKKYRSARKTLLWTIGIALLLDVPWDAFTIRLDLSPDHAPPGPRAWCLLMLIAFLAATDAVTKPALRSLRGELGADAGPAGPAPS